MASAGEKALHSALKKRVFDPVYYLFGDDEEETGHEGERGRRRAHTETGTNPHLLLNAVAVLGGVEAGVELGRVELQFRGVLLQ